MGQPLPSFLCHTPVWVRITHAQSVKFDLSGHFLLVNAKFILSVGATRAQQPNTIERPSLPRLPQIRVVYKVGQCLELVVVVVCVYCVNKFCVCEIDKFNCSCAIYVY